MTQRTSVTCGALLLGFGLLLLLATTGVIHIDFWGILIPALMIALGVLTLWTVTRRRDEPTNVELHTRLDGAERASIRVRFGAGRLSLGGGAAGEDLAIVQAFGAASQRATTVGDERTVDYWIPAEFIGDILAPWKWTGQHPPSWDLRLREGVPTRLVVEAGACELDLDLRSLVVRDLRLATGASAVTVRMPSAAGETHVRIAAGAAEIKVEVPPGVAARIHVPTGLGAVEVDNNRFPGGGGEYQSPDYASAANKVDLTVEIGAASFRIG
ncbi:MAG TPA: hypothetical protein VK449_06745 [Anaerolineales bacterium]|nr:hypothetical protein [Anaerolineales bacterium]